MSKGIGRSLVIALRADTKGFSREMRGAHKEITNFKNGINKIGKVVAASFAGMAVAAGAFAKDAIASASDLNETISKANVIFGKNAQHVFNWSNKAADSLGQSKQEAIDAAATFAIFGKSAGLTGEKLVKFSTNFTSLAADMASFSNTTPEEAVTALGSALRGESEPIRKYGVLLNDSVLKNRALTLGIIKNTKTALTPQQKVLAAQAEIYDQLKKSGAVHDFERTSNGLANQQRILAANLKNTKTEIGEALLPVMQKLTDWILKTGIPNLKSFVGVFTGKKSLTDAMKDGTDKAYRLGQKVKGFIDYCVNHTDQVKAFAAAVAGIWLVGKVASLLSSIAKVTAAYRTLTVAANAAAAAESRALGGGFVSKLKGAARRYALPALAVYEGYKQYANAEKSVMGDTKKQALFNLTSRMQSMGMVRQTPAVKNERKRMEQAYQKIDINVSGALNARDTALAIQKILKEYSLTGFPIQTVGKPTP